MAIDHHDQLHSPVLHQLAGHDVLVNPLPQNQCQMTPSTQEIVSHPSNQISIEPISTTLQKGDSVQSSLPTVRQNAKATYGIQLGDPSNPQASHDTQESDRQKNLQEPTQILMIKLWIPQLCSRNFMMFKLSHNPKIYPR